MNHALRTSRSGRVFTAECLGYITEHAHLFIDRSPTKGLTRPVLLIFACPTTTFRPFTANVAMGEPLMEDGKGFEIMRRAGYKLYPQEIGDVTVGTYLLEEAFELEPRNPFPEADEEAETAGGKESGEKVEKKPAPRPVRFFFMPDRASLEANTAALDVKVIVAHLLRVFPSARLPYSLESPLLRHIPALALLWAAYVDRRVNAPIIQEPEFIAQAFCAAAAAGHVTEVHGPGLDKLGFGPAWVCATSDLGLRGLLAQQIELYQTVKTQGYDAIKEAA